jgi:putative ABC transport system substrate-binding protein
MPHMQRRRFIALAGAAMAWPLAVHAQRKPIPVIGYLHFASSDYIPAPESFLQGLREYGYIDGQNVALEYRWAEGEYDRLPALAAELVAKGVDLIAAFGPPPAKAAKNATSTIPIVFEVGNDAVEAGLVTSLAQPGGNATGLSILFVQVTAKRLELLCELLPGAKTVGVLANPKSPTAEPSIRGASDAAKAKGVQLSVFNASTVAEINAAFAAAVGSKVQGMIVSADPFFDTQRALLVEVAAREKLPSIYFEDEFPNAGGLISYGSSLADVYRQMGLYAGKILKGAKPSELPVEQPTEFRLAINTRTAHDLGISVPPSLLATADNIVD